MGTELIGITGATGAVGGKVARHLTERGFDLRLLVRDPGRAPQLSGAELAICAYDDEAAMTRAFLGIDTLFLISAHEAEDRLEQHRRAVAAAAVAEVQKIVYLSFLAAAPEATFVLARQHYHTEEFIQGTGARFVFLRDSLYTDVVPFLVGADGVIRGPANYGRVAWVTRDDVARAAATVLTSADYDGSTFDLTGPESIDLSETATRLGQFIGRPITYHPETIEEAYVSRAVYNAPDWEVEGWVTSYAAIATGEMDVVTEAVKHLTGRDAMNLEQFLTAHPEGYEHLLA
ncbi:MAG: SDR family oxidoreductase [Acidimicrobiia bacterium]